MALLFIKQKMFPERKSRDYGHAKPLLSRSSDSDTLQSDSDQDVEAQVTSSYNTFGRRRPADEDSSSTNSNKSNSNSSNGNTSTSSGTRSRINPRIVSDAILGLSDGLTVPFALSAGLSALGKTKVVVLGGLAELAAGAISMGLGGYVGAKSEAEHYQATVRETADLIETSPAETSAIVHKTFSSYGLSDETITEIDRSLQASHERLQEFLITFHHRESQPDYKQAWISAITLALGYFVGGFIPLIPYFIASRVIVAFYWSTGVMAVTLFLFGYAKTCIVRGWTGRENVVAGVKGGVQMCLVGGLAAGAAIALVRAIDTGSA